MKLTPDDARRLLAQVAAHPPCRDGTPPLLSRAELDRLSTRVQAGIELRNEIGGDPWYDFDIDMKAEIDTRAAAILARKAGAS